MAFWTSQTDFRLLTRCFYASFCYLSSKRSCGASSKQTRNHWHKTSMSTKALIHTGTQSEAASRKFFMQTKFTTDNSWDFNHLIGMLYKNLQLPRKWKTRSQGLWLTTFWKIRSTKRSCSSSRSTSGMSPLILKSPTKLRNAWTYQTLIKWVNLKFPSFRQTWRNWDKAKSTKSRSTMSWSESNLKIKIIL